MIGTEIVKGANQVHSRMKGGGRAGQTPSPTSQSGQRGAEGGIETFDERGIDDAIALGLEADRFDLFGTALDNAADDAGQLALGRVLDDLGDEQVGPHHQGTPTTFGAGNRFPKHGLDRGHVGGKPVGTKQDRTRQG